MHPCLCVATLGSSRHVLLSSVAVVTGIVISISKQEYMFGYKAPFVAVRVSERVFLIYLLIDLLIIYFFGENVG